VSRANYPETLHTSFVPAIVTIVKPDPLLAHIRTVPDYPKKGIMFRDITPLLGDAKALKAACQQMAEPYQTHPPHFVAGIEARGFILGGIVAHLLGAGFIPIRKPGKLPYKSIHREYALEYGSGTLELHQDCVQKGQKVLLVDDLVATGGSAEAAVLLLRTLGAVVEAGSFLVDLPDLGGRKRLEKIGIKFHALLEFAGE
jgi:adenine phosphoribosyltransferase